MKTIYDGYSSTSLKILPDGLKTPKTRFITRQNSFFRASPSEKPMIL
jgi:hypothetical protein